jgi:hypothetical protein
MSMPRHFSHQTIKRNAATAPNQRGNIIFMVLLAIALIGLLTVAIQRTDSGDASNISGETLMIRASEVQRAASEIERAVMYIMERGNVSQRDLRFAIPTNSATEYGDITSQPRRQIFHTDGGAANYPTPPTGVQNAVAPWEFYGGTRIPGVGTNRPDLIAVLPNVTLQFCELINRLNGQTGSQPAEDGAGCINQGATQRFGTAFFNDATPNTLNDASFTRTPALQACVSCPADGGTYHFYHVLYAR